MLREQFHRIKQEDLRILANRTDLQVKPVPYSNNLAWVVIISTLHYNIKSGIFPNVGNELTKLSGPNVPSLH